MLMRQNCLWRPSSIPTDAAVLMRQRLSHKVTSVHPESALGRDGASTASAEGRGDALAGSIQRPVGCITRPAECIRRLAGRGNQPVSPSNGSPDASPGPPNASGSSPDAETSRFLHPAARRMHPAVRWMHPPDRLFRLRRTSEEPEACRSVCLPPVLLLMAMRQWKMFERDQWRRPCGRTLHERRPVSFHIERHLDRLIQFPHLRGVTRAHQPLQAFARHREHVVQVGNAPDGQPLSATEHDLGWKPSHCSSDQGDNDGADRVEDGIPGQDHDRPATNRGGQLGPPDLGAPQARPPFHPGIPRSSPTSFA